jgi:hypothetical protein
MVLGGRLPGRVGRRRAFFDERLRSPPHRATREALRRVWTPIPCASCQDAGTINNARAAAQPIVPAASSPPAGAARRTDQTARSNVRVVAQGTIPPADRTRVVAVGRSEGPEVSGDRTPAVDRIAPRVASAPGVHPGRPTASADPTNRDLSHRGARRRCGSRAERGRPVNPPQGRVNRGRGPRRPARRVGAPRSRAISSMRS